MIRYRALESFRKNARRPLKPKVSHRVMLYLGICSNDATAAAALACLPLLNSNMLDVALGVAEGRCDSGLGGGCSEEHVEGADL